MGINRLLNQTITLNRFSSRNAYDEPTRGSSISVKGRFQPETKIVKGPNGEDIGTDALVFIPASQAVTLDDKITYDSVEYRVVTVGEAVNGKGNTDHYEVRVQRTG